MVWRGADDVDLALHTAPQIREQKKAERKVTKETKLRSLFLPLLLRSLRCLL
jgi:hypothetical protein